MATLSDIVFDPPLVEGIIQKRTSIYTVSVDVAGEMLSCHCPTTGRIGKIDVGGRPCLLSKATGPKRKTSHTVEAVSLSRYEDTDKAWIGINQNGVNRYVAHYLLNGGFSEMIDASCGIKREQLLDKSKLDFLVGNTYLEVKMPLQQLQIDIPDYVETKKNTSFSSTERFIKHITELAKSLGINERAILLICFVYDNPGFEVVEKSINYEQVKEAVEKSIKRGVETWQANFQITPGGVRLDRYFRISV